MDSFPVVDGDQQPKRYRGYRPPPLWWFKLKYAAAMAVFALMVVATAAQLTTAVLTGQVLVLFGDRNELVLWSSSWVGFLWNMFLWTGCGLLAFGGFLVMKSKLKELRGPAAETRL